jgi:hypothetical protein
MLVAISDFNMGAMENKGLNIFNSKYILAASTTATDADFENILRCAAWLAMNTFTIGMVIGLAAVIGFN